MCFDYFLLHRLQKRASCQSCGRAAFLIIGVFLINRESLRLQNYGRDTRSFEVKSNQLIFQRNKAPHTSYKLEEIEILLGYDNSSFDKHGKQSVPDISPDPRPKEAVYVTKTNDYLLKIIEFQVCKNLQIKLFPFLNINI